MKKTLPASPRSGLWRATAAGPRDAGFMMVAILIGMGVAAIMMTAALPSWRQQVQRTREEELIFRGEQYARAIVLYYLKNNGTYPASIDVLVSQHFLRKKWKDPVTNDDFALVGVGIINLPGAGTSTPVGGQTPVAAGSSTGRGGASAVGGTGQPGITGVRSKSPDTSIKIYQQQQQYNLWQFDASLIAPKMGVNLNAARQGQGGQGGRPGQTPGQGGRGGVGGADRPAGGRGGQGGTGPGRGGGATPPATPPTTGRGRGGN